MIQAVEGATIAGVGEADSSGTRSAPRREPYPVAARKLLRETLLDAAMEELEDRQWDEVTMAGVAARAGVSRQTLYKEFGSRDEFAQAFVIREGERFLAAVEEAILGNRDDPRTALRTAFEVFLEAAAEHPLVRSALSGRGAQSILPLLTTEAGPIVEFAGSRLAEIIVTGWPDAPRHDVDLLSGNLVRLAISYLSVRHDDPAETASEITRLLGPFIEWALAGGGGPSGSASASDVNGRTGAG